MIDRPETGDQPGTGHRAPSPVDRTASPMGRVPFEPVPDQRLAEVARLATRLGFTAFGGPAAHIAMLRDEVVTRRGWFDDRHFADLIGITNLIPGPNSTEMVMHAGSERAGWRGLVVAGVGFIVPASLITLAFAWVYVRWGTVPEIGAVLAGIKPVIIAIVAQALVGLGRSSLVRSLSRVVALAVVLLGLAGVNEIVLLVGGALAGLLVHWVPRGGARVMPLALGGWGPPFECGLAPLLAVVATTEVTTWRLLLTFLKIGSVLYGSGYVLIAFLERDLVTRHGWVTEAQLLDAVAVGQVTPGPVFTTATFLGYVIGGWWGALAATVGIFLPAFALVALTNPILSRLRRSAILGAALDGVTAASLGLMAVALAQLTGAAIAGAWTAVLAVAAALLLVRTRLNSGLLIAAGAFVGLMAGFV